MDQILSTPELSAVTKYFSSFWLVEVDSERDTDGRFWRAGTTDFDLRDPSGIKAGASL